MDQFRAKLVDALALELPYFRRPVERPVRGQHSAVLLILGFSSHDKDFSDPFLLVTKRAETLEKHRGQMAFPGGMCEKQDQGAAIETALRETEEEVGIMRSQVDVVGTLPGLVTATTDFWIEPVVAILRGGFEETKLRSNPGEIDQALWVSLCELRKVYREEMIRFAEVNYPMPVYEISGRRIWGATGAMIQNLLQRLA